MKRILPLLLISSMVFAIPTAEIAREQTKNSYDARAQHDVTLLWAEADTEINDSVKRGYFEADIITKQYSLESIHIVNERLRKLGYKCE